MTLDTIEKLLEALTEAPQDKEGAFRVSTWKMVIAELVAIQERLGKTSDTATAAIDAAHTAQEKAEAVSTNVQKNLADEESDTILF